MKSVFILIFLNSVAFAQNNNFVADIDTTIDGPIIKFDSVIANYGVIEKGSDGKRIFTYTNIGNKPLIISTVKSSCGCLVPSWSREPLYPGDTGKIQAVYDTKRIGPINKSLTVQSNSINTPTKVLKIKGKVFDPIMLLGEKTLMTDTNKIDFGVLKKGELVHRHLILKNKMPEAVFIDSIKCHNKFSSITIQEIKINPKDSALLKITYQFPKEEPLSQDKHIWGGILIYGKIKGKPFIFNKVHLDGVVKKD